MYRCLAKNKLKTLQKITYNHRLLIPCKDIYLNILIVKDRIKCSVEGSLGFLLVSFPERCLDLMIYSSGGPLHTSRATVELGFL